MDHMQRKPLHRQVAGAVRDYFRALSQPPATKEEARRDHNETPRYDPGIPAIVDVRGICGPEKQRATVASELRRAAQRCFAVPGVEFPYGSPDVFEQILHASPVIDRPVRPTILPFIGGRDEERSDRPARPTATAGWTALPVSTFST